MSEYRNDVDAVAEDIIDFAKDSDQTGEQLREAVLEYMHESLDGCARVIYTGQAQEGLAESNNDGAYADNYGTEGMVTDCGINWSALMYAAMEQDVIERLDALGFDINNPEASLVTVED